MDFGLFVACHRFDESLSARDVYDHALDAVRLADEAGFRTAWFPDVKGGFTPPDPVADEFTSEQLLANLVAGTPDVVVEKLRQYEALGVDHFIMYAPFGTDHGVTMRSLRLFAERVMPHFAASRAQEVKRC
jgi:alkanesulfonate monooxygenase SsuD/methylene tetrahydromethanopterin reductase-like flavin-dependent oxidoreductase (luciferase family)